MGKNRKIPLELLAVTAAMGLLLFLSSSKSELMFVSPDETLPQMEEQEAQEPVEGPQVIAHRGNSANAPENSIPAFEQAIRQGVDWIELDVHQTKDGVVVVCHDADLRRTAGVNKNIWELTYEEVEQYDVGSWFSSSYQNLHMPTLEEVLKLCKGKVKLNIELKPTGHEEDLEEQVVRLVSSNGMERECVLASQMQASLKAVKSLDSNLTTLYVLPAATPNVWQGDFADHVSIQAKFIDAEVVDDVHRAGKKLYAWTVNDSGDMRKLLLLGADGIITDEPEKALSVRESLNAQ